jgi:MerR family transcriptional regulator, repressor of the yfmOP operon
MDQASSGPATPEETYYSIDQIATRTGLTKRTLRYYEEMQLLPPAERTEGNYRRYTEQDAQLIERIKNLRELLGFSLNEIREILKAEEERVQVKQAYHLEDEPLQKIALLDRADAGIHMQLTLIEQKIHGLEQMRTTLLEKLEKHEQVKKSLRNSKLEYAE